MKKQTNNKQDVLCQIVDVFVNNGIKNNEDIVAICSKLTTDKLRGIKRSLTLKKRKAKMNGKTKLAAKTFLVLKKAMKNPEQYFTVWIPNKNAKGGLTFNKMFTKILYGNANNQQRI